MCNQVHMTLLNFILLDLRVNSSGRIEVLETVVTFAIDRVANGSPYRMQQCISSYESQVTQEWMADNFHDYLTP